MKFHRHWHENQTFRGNENLMPFDFALLTILSVMAVLGSTGNLCIIATVYKSNSLRRVTHILIMNQALSDFLLSALSIPLRMLRISVKKSMLESSVLSSDMYCRTISGLNAAVIGTSSYGLVLVTIDKFLAANRPIAYRTRMRIAHMGIPIILSWLIPLIMGVCGAFIPVLQADLYDHKHDVACIKSSTFCKEYALCAYVVMLILPLIIMFPLYICILVKVKRSGRILIQPMANEDELPQPSHRSHQRIEQDEAHRRKEVKLTKGIILILGIHLSCLTPIIALDIIHITLAHPIPHKLDEIFLLLLHLNAVLDPIIYTRHIQEIKRTIFRLFCPCRPLVRFIHISNSLKSRENRNVIKTEQRMVTTQDTNPAMANGRIQDSLSPNLPETSVKIIYLG